MEIIKLVKANIRQKKESFISIAVLMLLICFTLSVVISNNQNINAAMELSHEALGSPDAFVLFNETAIEPDFFEKLEAHPQVERVDNVKTAFGFGSINGKDIGFQYLLCSQEHDIYRVLNEDFSGYVENPEPLKEGEIYLNYSLLSDVKAEPGDIFTLRDGEEEYSFTLKGFVEEPMLGSCVISLKQVFIHEADLNKLLESPEKYGLVPEQAINIYFAEGTELDKAMSELDESCSLVGKSVACVSRDEIKAYTNLYGDIASGVLMVFALLLAAIVLVTMCSSISGTVETEYVSLGILKAQGFSSGKICLVYVLQYLLALALGAVLGMAAAAPFTGFVGRLFQPLTGLVAPSGMAFISSLLPVLGIMLLGTASAFIAASGIRKVSPVRAISGNRSEVYFDSRLNVPIKARAMSLLIAFRQFSSDKKRYLVAVLVLALLMFFLVSIGLLTRKITTDEMLWGSVESQVDFKLDDSGRPEDLEKIEKLIQELDGEAKLITNNSNWMLLEGQRFLGMASNRPEELFRCFDGRLPIYDNEISLTDVVAERIDKKIGDTVELSFEGKDYEFIVCGIHQHLNEVGKNFVISMERMYELTGAQTYCYVCLSDWDLTDEAEKLLVDYCGERLAYKEVYGEEHYDSSTSELINSICGIVNAVIYAVALVFVALIVSMVCSRSFEKERIDLGIYKAVGFTANRLRLQFALRFTIVAFIGCVIGALASCLFTRELLELLLKMLGITRVEDTVGLAELIAPTLLLTVTAFAFGWKSAGRVKQISVRNLISE